MPCERAASRYARCTCTAWPTTAQAEPASSIALAGAGSMSSPTTAAPTANPKVTPAPTAISRRVDLHRVLDAVEPGPIVLIGTSLGAAVALQEASHDRRVVAVVAVVTFLRPAHRREERAPFFFTPGIIARAFELAERQGRFQVDAVSPRGRRLHRQAARAADSRRGRRRHPPDHSQRVLAALTGPKRLILVPGAGHNESLRGDVWAEIERWLDGVLVQSPVAP